MNEQDKFECRHQEIHDDNTNVTIRFGTHAGSGHRWLQIAVPYGNPDNPTEAGETKTSTITFGPDGQVLKILPHVQGSTETENPDVENPKEELAHLAEIEQSLPSKSDEDDDPADDEETKVAKRAKRGKK